MLIGRECELRDSDRERKLRLCFKRSGFTITILLALEGLPDRLGGGNIDSFWAGSCDESFPGSDAKEGRGGRGLWGPPLGQLDFGIASYGEESEILKTRARERKLVYIRQVRGNHQVIIRHTSVWMTSRSAPWVIPAAPPAAAPPMVLVEFPKLLKAISDAKLVALRERTGCWRRTPTRGLATDDVGALKAW